VHKVTVCDTKLIWFPVTTYQDRRKQKGLRVHVPKANTLQTQTDTDEQKPHKICFEVDHISIFLIICSECFITVLIRMKIIIYQVQIYIREKKTDWEH